MAYEDLPWWYRSSPYVGALGGLLAAVQAHLVGVDQSSELFGLSLTGEIQALFDASPVLGYVVFVAFGAGLGWALRALERRFA